ncbi:glycosyltransferase [Methylomonas methanica]|uniref:Glycosyltransferase involved in cell wall biosynthesis n=1 Tax=Methylomonas methanica (strain DSM 25384 / MC09) TaxID=857087 RepID=G0A3H2_METMM|nr:glycosyltransferase [Methylomonas methanica]AEG00271.1 hypothetical protein Metme_1855 [Methylomonas methanica MC09]
MTNQTVVFIVEELPVPRHSGYSTYNHAFLKALQTAGYQIHLVVCGNRFPSPFFKANRLLGLPGLHLHIAQAIALPDGWYLAGPLGFLKAVYRRLGGMCGLKKPSSATAGKPVIIGRWLNQSDLALLTPILQMLSPQMIFVDTLFRSPVLAAVDSRCRRFLIGHDVFSLRCQSMAANGFQPVPWISAQDEAAALQKFDAVIAITDADAEEYRRLQPNVRVEALPSPVTPIADCGARPDSGRIFYLGSQAHHNVDGLRWFLDKVWPRVLQTNPTLELDVVGSIGASFSGVYPHVVWHGRLDDFSALAERAMFAINPVRAGSGMKIKILDYLAHGLACITTTVGIAGFPGEQERPLAVCDDAEGFAQTVLEWSGNPAYCSTLSARALDYVGRFSGAEFNAGLQALIADTLASPESAR